MMRFANRCLVSLAAALLLTSGFSRADDAQAMRLLHEAVFAPRVNSFIGEVQSLRFGSRKSEAAIYRIEHRAPHLTRRWYIAPQDLYGDSTISRGDTTYAVDIKRDRIVVTNNADVAVDLDDHFELMSKNYRAVFGPDEMLAGRPTRVLSLLNRYTGQTTLRVWIDTVTKLILQKELFAPNGTLISQMRFARVRYTDDIPLGVFTVPKNYSAVGGLDHRLPFGDMHRLTTAAGFDARDPRYLPDGFVPIAGNVVEIKGVRTLHFLYSDGIRTVSLFQNAHDSAVDLSGFRVTGTSVHGHIAQYVEDGPTTLLAWVGSGLHFALVGELSRNELVRIASSIEP